jgi:adenine phosphoribosyltransferase
MTDVMTDSSLRSDDRAKKKGKLMDLKQYVRDVWDFPQPGVLFRDITPLLQNPVAFSEVIETLTAKFANARLEAIVGIESRGFIFGAPLAFNLGLPLVPIRKPGKLPAATMSVEYALEYGEGQLDIHQDAIAKGQRVLIVDDLLATGGTAKAAAQLVEMLGGNVGGFAFLVELIGLNGRERLEGYDVTSLIQYS